MLVPDSKNSEKKYTAADYLTWPDDERWEIIDGVPYMMTPAPSPYHQMVSGEIHTQMSIYFRGKSCKSISAPVDVYFKIRDDENDMEINKICQPDVIVVCDMSKIKRRGYFGIPTIVVEILSPSTSRNDWILKYNMYESVGVKQYWIVDPDGRWVQVFTLQGNNKYGVPEKYTDEDKIKVSLFPDLEIDLSLVFADIPEKIEGLE